MKNRHVNLALLASLSTFLFPASAQTSEEPESRVLEFQLAALWQGVSGESETMVQTAAKTCRPALEASLAECDAALSSASDDPETVDLHSYCRRLSNDEFIECVKAELQRNND